MPSRFRALDGWRGIAAVMVALYHAPFLSALSLNPLVRNSYLWVDFFFVLSGFVIAHATVAEPRDGSAAGRFLIRRFGRVWPLHIFVLALFVLVEGLKLVVSENGLLLHQAPFTGTHSLASLLANVALVHSLGLFDTTTWNGPSWSICAEFWTYVVFAGLAFLMPRWTRGLAAAICIAAGLTLWTASQYRAFGDLTYDFGLVRCLFGFFLGYLAYQFARARVFRPRAWVANVAEIAALAGSLGFVCLAGTAIPPYVAALVFAGAVLVFAAEAGGISRLLGSNLAVRLGDWSYSIYMTHLLVLTLLLEVTHVAEKLAGIRVLQSASPTDPDVLSFALPGPEQWAAAATILYIALTLLVSAITWRLVECPGRAAFGRIARRRGTPVSLSVAPAKAGAQAYSG